MNHSSRPAATETAVASFDTDLRETTRDASATALTSWSDNGAGFGPALTELAQDLSFSPDTEPEQFASQARQLSSLLPTEIKQRLYDFARWGSPTGLIRISGFPTGELPETPVGNQQNLAGRTMGAKCSAILTAFLGELVGYEAEAGGALIQDMAPDRAKAAEQMSVGYSTELELHVEQAHNPLRPDFLTLFCLRGDSRAKTYTLTAKMLVDHLDSDEVAALREPRWTIGVDPSFKEFTTRFELGLIRGPGPILYGSEDDPFIIFDQDLQRGTDPEAQDLLEKCIDVYVRHRGHVTLEPGDFAAVDNHRAVHGRSAYFPRFDGTDRWIARAFAVVSLATSAHARPCNGRIIAARYC